MSKEDWPKDEESLALIEDNWDEHFNDRSQKLVFIGKKEILSKITKSHHESLLTDGELSSHSLSLKKLKDPFGDWNKLLESSETVDA